MKKYIAVTNCYLQGVGSITEGQSVELDAETGSLFKERGFLRDADVRKEAKAAPQPDVTVTDKEQS